MAFAPAPVSVSQDNPDTQKTVLFALQKGGTTKTTSSLHIGWCAARLGLNVLVIDAAPNATLTTSCFGFLPHGVNEDGTEYHYETIADVITAPVAVGSAASALVKPDDWQPSADLPWSKGGAHREGGSLWLMPGWGSLQRAADDPHAPDGARRLSKALSGVSQQFDLVIIDSDPAVGNVFMLALLSAGHVFAPVIAEQGAANGLVNQIDAVEGFATAWDHNVDFIGALCCRYQRRNTATHGVIREEMEQMLADRAGDEEKGQLFPELVPEASAMQRAQLNYAPVTTQRDPLARIVDEQYARATLRMIRLMGLPAYDDLATYLDNHPLDGVWPLTTSKED